MADRRRRPDLSVFVEGVVIVGSTGFVSAIIVSALFVLGLPLRLYSASPSTAL